MHQSVTYSARALLNSASEASFISDTFKKRLGISVQSTNATISGVDGRVSATTSRICSFQLHSAMQSEIAIPCTAFVLPRITGNLPSCNVTISNWSRCDNLELADDQFHVSAPVDLLLGGYLYPSLVLNEVQRNVFGHLLAQKTVFGWVLTGTVPVTQVRSHATTLTPGHFLIGAPLLSPAEVMIDDPLISIVNRWQRLKAFGQAISLRWKKEYLKELHKRFRWKFPTKNIDVDDIVLIRQENLPPTEWRLGRVIKVHSGFDGRVRVADLRTQKGLVTRSLAKLVILPSKNLDLSTLYLQNMSQHGADTRESSPTLSLGRLFDEPRIHRWASESRESSPVLSLDAAPVLPDERLPAVNTVPSIRPPPERRTCFLCPLNHRLGQCRVFKRYPVERRLRAVVQARVCGRCLSPHHATRSCLSTGACTECDGDHHTLLHMHPSSRPPRNQQRSRRSRGVQSASAQLASLPPGPTIMDTGVLTVVPTASVLGGASGRRIRLRALINSCSPVSQVSRSVVRRLGIPTTMVGQEDVCSITLTSIHDVAQHVTTVAQIASDFPVCTPARDMPSSIPELLSSFKLADPTF